ncbi:hypothetical protein GCM10010207_80010 [Streptomyces atratus]|nr:hypothetical protein GCM10010207_80010 [Streptomyces atratus]
MVRTLRPRRADRFAISSWRASKLHCAPSAGFPAALRIWPASSIANRVLPYSASVSDEAVPWTRTAPAEPLGHSTSRQSALSSVRRATYKLARLLPSEILPSCISSAASHGINTCSACAPRVGASDTRPTLLPSHRAHMRRLGQATA